MTTPSVWELAADDLVAVLLNDEQGRNQIVYELNIMPAHMPTQQHRAVFEAVKACMAAGEPIHDTTVRDKCGSVVPLDWYTQRAYLFDDSRLNMTSWNAGIVRKHGMSSGVRHILKKADDMLAGGTAYEDVTGRLMTALAGLDSGTTIRNETGGAAADEFAQLMNSDAPMLPKVGLPWLDALTGGVDRGHMWWIAAPYKSRKSTVMLNVALGLYMTWMTRGGTGPAPSIGIASGEMPRARISAQFVAMLAAAHIMRMHRWNGTYQHNGRDYPMHQISPTLLQQARKEYRKWHPHRVEAVDYGIEQYRQSRNVMRIYDRSHDGGALGDLRSLMTIMRRDKHMFGTTVFFIDYLQMFMGDQDPTLFDYVSRASFNLQRFAASEGITLVILAQQNEETIKNGGSSSGGVKGGGDPTATADYFITSKYRTGELPSDGSQLELMLKFSRHGVGGDDTRRACDIHAPSGLLLDHQWIARI